MPLTVTELAEEVRESNRRLADAIQGLTAQVAVINHRLDFIRRVGWVLALWALGMLGTALYVVRQATRIEDTVAVMQKDFAELKTDFKARDKHISESLDRIEKALAHNPPGPKPTP
jgi:apolipoprotein N-acyltransferase